MSVTIRTIDPGAGWRPWTWAHCRACGLTTQYGSERPDDARADYARHRCGVPEDLRAAAAALAAPADDARDVLVAVSRGVEARFLARRYAAGAVQWTDWELDRGLGLDARTG